MHSRFRRVTLAVGAMLPAVATAAGAAVDEELREVIVTAKSLEVTTPLELSRFGYDVFFLPEQQIRNQGFVDLTQAIEMMVPGVFLATQYGAFSYVNLSLQGSRPQDVLWTVDGVRINNRLYNTTSPADTLPSGMIERLEVLKGGQGLLYGTSAVAGVVNVVTRGFSDEWGGAITLGGDTNSGLHLDGNVRGALGDHHFVAWASKNTSDGYMPFDFLVPGATTRDRAYDVTNYGLKYRYDFSERARLTLQGTHTDAKVDFPSPVSTNVNDRDEDIFIARLDLTPSEQLEFYFKGYVHDWDTDYYPATNPAASGFWGFDDKGFSASARIAPTGSPVEYIVGYDIQRYSGVDEVLVIEEQTETTQALYGQIRSTDALSEKTRFTAGIRYNHADAGNSTVWSLSGVHEFSDSFYTEAVIGTSFLLPDAYSLYANDPSDGWRGNPDLEPEESLAFSLSLGGQLPVGTQGLGWKVTGWHREVSNLITQDYTNPPPGFEAVFTNIDEEVTVYGGELLLRAALLAGLSADASFTYSREKMRGSTQQLPNRPLHSGKLGLSWSPDGARYGVDVSMKYFGTTRSGLTLAGAETYGGDIIANLGAHVFLDAAHHHRLGLRVENLFDTDYATQIASRTVAGTPVPIRRVGPPITGFLNYTYSF